MKEFLLLIREASTYADIPSEEMAEEISKHMSWVENLKHAFKDGNPVAAEGAYIEGLSKGVSLKPYTVNNTKLAKDCPALQTGATIEIREVYKSEENPD